MSVRTPASAFARQKNEAYYTPPHAVHSLIDFADEVALFGLRSPEIWECAAGAGHIARVLHEYFTVLATDLNPAKRQVHPVTKLNFLTSTGPSDHPFMIVTNPPYGNQNREALAFIKHGFMLMRQGRCETMGLLLPFEIDAPLARNGIFGEHPNFVRKVTVGRRIRWLNLPQSKNAPMGNHSWFIWSTNMALHRRARGPGIVR